MGAVKFRCSRSRPADRRNAAASLRVGHRSRGRRRAAAAERVMELRFEMEIQSVCSNFMGSL